MPADLNMEDDLGRGMARLPDGFTAQPGDVLTAGRPGFWDRVVVDEVADGVVYFWPVTR